MVAHIGSTRLTRVDAGVLNGLYALLLSSGRRPSSRSGKGYEPEVVSRAVALRANGLTLVATAEFGRIQKAICRPLICGARVNGVSLGRGTVTAALSVVL